MHKEIIKIEENIWKAFEDSKNEINNGIGLYMGLSGVALFYDSLFEAYPSEEYETKLLEVIEKASELVEHQQNVASICSGVAGYGIMLLRLKSKTIEIEEEYYESIDDILLDQFVLFGEANGYDFMHESMGIAMYFVERFKKSQNENIKQILDSFAKDFIEKINADFEKVLIKYDDDRGDYYSFGLAHGAASYINFLIYLDRNYELLNLDVRGAVKTCIKFLRLYKNYDQNSKQYFANVISIKSNMFIPSRLSWCQGDLGISNSFYNAGLFLKDEQLVNESIFLMNHSASLSFEDSAVNDFGICHGSCGILLQLFLASKKYQMDYENELKRWLEELKKQTDDFAQYPWFDNSKLEYYSQINLLLGAAGLGLTLLTLDNKIDVKWLEILNLH